GKRNFEKDAWQFAGTMEWRIPESAWNIRTGVTYTDAKKANGVGQFARNPIGNTRARFNSPPYADIDYVPDGEVMGAL
ncbi:outer membrane porin, OprD family, partial [Proteus mirabilis]|nr:outer membrane porin, OprD family [Proteus mirabilis]